MSSYVVSKLSLVLGSLIFCTVAGAEPPSRDGAFLDPLDARSTSVEGAATVERQPMVAVARAGNRLVAVGLRGRIVVSDDQGESWRQASVPVQSDLTAVHFPTAERGWAVGHEGVILYSEDSGSTWRKQIDGRDAARLLAPYYKEKITAGEENYSTYLEQLLLNTEAGPVLPYLGVHFEDERNGYAVGAFGLIVRTEDGGKTWMPWMHKIDNQDFFNLNEIRKVDSDLYIVGEQGSVFRLNRDSKSFDGFKTSYTGSLFGLTGNERNLVVFGLRGNAFISNDRGESWARLESDIEDAFVAGATSDDGNSVILVTSGGRIVLSKDGGRDFKTSQATVPMLYSGAVADTSGGFVLAGWGGLVSERINASDSATKALSAEGMK